MTGIDPHGMAALGPADATRALIAHLESLANADNVAGMARFGITGAHVLGISVATLREVVRGLLKTRRRDDTWRHDVAAHLWASGIHEARVLSSLLDVPALVTHEQALARATDSDSWDITDQLCMNLLDKAPFAFDLVREWSSAEETFVKRAAFALAASLASHDKSAPDERFLAILQIVEREACDERNFVTKAIDWALRGIGKRSVTLHGPALETARRLAARPERAARRVGRVSVRELESAGVLERLGIG